MASIGGVSGSNLNSIYGSRNVISGLASGMDTEGMIENAVSGIKNRISGLEQKRTKWQWKQAAFQGVTDKLVQFSNKYASYTSPTNLLSSSFFNKALLTTSTGANAGKVSATGKSTSDVYINAVKQLANAGRGTATGGVVGSGNSTKVTAGGSIDLAEQVTLSNMSGSIDIKYGDNTVTLDFDEQEVYKTPEDLKNAIIDKLSEEDITFSDGTTVKANEKIQVDLDANGEIKFSDKSAGGNSVYISGASGDLEDTLDLGDVTGKPDSFTVDMTDRPLFDETGSKGEYLSGKEISFTYNGVKKTIKMPKYGTDTAAGEISSPADYTAAVNKALGEAFGTDKIKVTNAAINPNELQLEFTVDRGSSLSVSGTAAKLMELDGEATYLNMGETLGELGIDFTSGTKPIEAVGDPTKFKPVKDEADVFTDNNGNKVKKVGDKYYQLDKEGNVAQGHDLVINDKVVGTFTKDTSIDTIIAKINGNTEAGVNVSYSKTTGQFTFTAKETGAAHGVKLNDGLARELFGGLAAKNADGTDKVVDQDIGVRGQDAIINTTINGNPYEMIRSSNTIEIDGMTITLNEAFNSDIIDEDGKIADPSKIKDKVGFTSKSDADKVVDAIKTMVDDYNAILKEVKELYGTPPAQRTNGSKYEPLTDAQKEGMSETAIKGYEETAKQGILFADQDLSSLYEKLRTAIIPAGADGNALREMGLSSDYSNTTGTSITLDEEKLRAMLETNPDAVKDAFTKSKDGGATTNGIMTNVKTVLDSYANTTGATKGILIEKAGSKYAPTSILKNSIKDSTDSIDKEILRWENKLSDSIDRYTRQFTQLEKLIAEMNSQSSALMGMMGGNG